MIPSAVNPAAECMLLAHILFSQIAAINRSFHKHGLYNTDQERMRNRPFYLMVVLLAGLIPPCLAENPVISTATKTIPTVTNPPEQEDSDQPEGEAKGVIPPGTVMAVSTQTVTPVTIFPEKKPYDESQDELAKAQDLFKKGEMEAASDTALEAYDDLMAVHLPRRKRSKLRTQRYQAATIYVQAGIAFIKDFVKRTGNSTQAAEEAKSRLEDLRDVARDYDDLRGALNKAIEELSTAKHP